MADSVKDRLRRFIRTSKGSDVNPDDVITLTEGGISYRLMLPHRSTDYIQQRISSEARPYEVGMLEDMKSRLQPGEHVIDVGANVGNHTMYLAAVAGSHVTAFEPNPELCGAIRVSARINDLDDRIVVHQTGVGAATGRGEFAHLDQSNLGAQDIRVSDDADAPIEIVSLDSMTWDHRIRMIKIDVEGMELAVLQGAVRLIERDHPVIYVESQSEPDFDAILEFMSGRGYACVMSFNATPTQLYLHESRLREDGRIVEYLTGMVRRIYHAANQAIELRRRFDEANLKYHNANERISALKHKLDAANEKYRQSTEALSAIKQKLRDGIVQDLDPRQIDESMTTSIRTMAQELKASEQKYLESLDQISALTRELSVANTAMKNAMEKHAELDVKYRTESQRWSEMEQSLTHRSQASEQALAAARAEYAELEGELSSVISRLKHVEAELKQAHGDHSAESSRHQAEYADLMQRFRSTEADLFHLQSEHQSLNTRFMQLEASHQVVLAETSSPGFVTADDGDQYHRRTVDQILALKQKIEAQGNKINEMEIRIKDYRAESARKLAELRGSATYQAGAYMREAARSWRAMAGLPARLWRLRRTWRAVTQQRSTPSSADPAAGLRRILPARQHIGNLLQRSLPGSSARSLRIACIMDDFTFSSYAPECILHPLTPAAWREEIETSRPDLLFIESAWRGKDELWGSKVGHTCQELQGIIQWCRVHQVPTVFWNKEDPIHFETFLNTARLFDFIFTTDIDCIQRYKAALGHNRVYLLPFACQPAIHNPIEKYQRKDAFCFAGAYYTRYPERTRDLECFVNTLPGHRPLVIYDRNHGKDHPDYRFPEVYRPHIIGSLPFAEIDKAYKGYQYAINLNSIKQSQTMFARRVYELLASNTITVSNFSRGLRLMFGDLVLCSDNGDEIVNRLAPLSTDDSWLRKYRLAGLRKVMRQHTYQDRLAYIAAKIEGRAFENRLPSVLVTACASDQIQFDKLMAHFRRQTHPEKHLLVVTNEEFQPAIRQGDDRITIVDTSTANGIALKDLVNGNTWIAGMVPDDYYGPNYLTDLVIATRYCSLSAIGKVAHHGRSADGILSLTSPDAAYQINRQVACRSSIVNQSQVGQIKLLDWVAGLHQNQIENCDVLAIDEFNYCRNGAVDDADLMAVESMVNDLHDLDEGIDLSVLIDKAERISPQTMSEDRSPVMTGADLARHFKPKRHRHYQLCVDGARWMIKSTLPDGQHEYLYAARDVTPTELAFDSHARFHLDITPGLNIQMVMLFLDSNKERIGHIISPANRNIDEAIPEGTAWIRLGIRLYSFGSAAINSLVLGHRSLQPAEVIGRSNYLLLTNHYPSYDDLYRNAFVHTRVKGYLERGLAVDVFRLRTDEALSFHEYQDVDVITGSQAALHKLLEKGGYEHVLVHFLDQAMWSVLKDHIDDLRVTVWVHGAEIHPWYRRKYNIDSPEQEVAARLESDKRMSFWKGLLGQMPDNLRLIFVSRTFAEEVMEDLGFRLPEDKYSIIHNPIDTRLFSYVPKPPEQRTKILSIRPYASRQYANDLSVKAILSLKDHPCFKDLEFRLIGDGKLFDETVAPLKSFSNVILEKKFLTRSEIADLHKHYGIFLCPTRWDSQGVSRDEAMASGLVPITSKVAAIPEFVDDNCGIIVDSENVNALALAIIKTVDDPVRFHLMSENSARRTRSMSDFEIIMRSEINLIQNHSLS